MDDILLMLEDEIESINAVLDARDVDGYIAHLEISRKLHGDAMRVIARLRADNKGLRGACDGVPDMLENEARLISSEFGWNDEDAETFRKKATVLRAALAAPADGSGAGTGDGGVQS